MRPLIAVTPLVDLQRESYWMLPGYLEGLEAAGGAPVVLPLTGDPQVLEPIFQQCSGLLLTGGQDVDPALYGRGKLGVCGELCPERDYMERWLLSQALARDMPVLGICRGLQFLNVFLGGTLYQDLPTQRPSPVTHAQRHPYSQPVHTVTVAQQGLLAKILGPGPIQVNSCHHQGVEQLASGLRADGVSEDGLIEAAHRPGQRFVLGVQWHPEFCYQSQPQARAILEAFVQACQ